MSFSVSSSASSVSFPSFISVSGPGKWMNALTHVFYLSSLFAFVELKVADLFPPNNSPVSVQQLAKKAGGWNAERLFRLLDQLQYAGIVSREPGNNGQSSVDISFSLTPDGECLRSVHPSHVGAIVKWVGTPLFRISAMYLPDLIREPGTCYEAGAKRFVTEQVHRIDPSAPVPDLFTWMHQPDQYEQYQCFDEAMSAFSAAELGMVLSMLEQVDLPSHHTVIVIDLGGGRDGGLVKAILQRCTEIQKGVVADIPAMIENGQAAEEANPCGLMDNHRLIFAGVDLFDVNLVKKLVDTHAEAAVFSQSPWSVILKHILHAWEDDEAVQILSNISQAVRQVYDSSRRSQAKQQTLDSFTLFIIEFIILPDDHPDATQVNRFTTGTDVHMIWGPGGKERSVHPWQQFFEQSGWKYHSLALAQGMPLSVIQAKIDIEQQA